MNTKTSLCLLACLTTAAILPAKAAILVQWNFNSIVPDNNVFSGVVTPSIGSGTFSLVGTTSGMSSGNDNGGSSDPATGDDSVLVVGGFPSQGIGSQTEGIQFSVSTVGFQNIVVSWDQLHASTSSRHGVLQYSINGSTFTTFGSFEHTSGGFTWFNGRSFNLSSVTGANDNPAFAFRILSSFAPSTSEYAPSNPSSTYGSGSWRFDMVTVSGTPVPEPEEYAAMAGVALIGFAVWRRQAKR